MKTFPKAITTMVVLVGLASSGVALNQFLPASADRVGSNQSEAIAAKTIERWAWLGGFRAMTADFVWLRMQASWEVRDRPGSERLIRLTTAVDPRALYFWLNGVRIVAYDFPVWRIEAEGGNKAVSPERKRVIDREQALLALGQIATARTIFPMSAALWIEQANIELNRLHDIAAAAESYRQAWSRPGAPYYVARLHAEMLRRLGRTADAYHWLCTLHPQLPANDEGAMANVVLARIRELERELATPSAEIYQPVDQ